MKHTCLLPAAMLAFCASAQSPSVPNLVVEEENGTSSVFSTADVKAVLFEEMPDYVEASELIQAVYTPMKSVGLYEVAVSNGLPDVNGNPVKVGDFSVVVNFTAPLSEDRRDAVLPDGYYRLGNGTQPFTFDVSKTAIYTRFAEGPDGVNVSPCISGTIDVKIVDGSYDLRFELVSFDGTVYNVSYGGTIPFVLSSTGFESFTEDLDISFEGCQGRFYGNWTQPFADDITLQLFTGDFNANGYQISGYWYNIYMNMPKVADPMNPVQTLADGVYTIDTRKVVNDNTYMPFTCQIGQTTEEFGMLMNMGTVLSYTDPMGDNRIGLAESGTLTVSENGTKIVIDFYTAEGLRIGGTFEGVPDIHNFCDNDKTQPKRPYSALTEDIRLDFIPTTVGLYFSEGAIMPGLEHYSLWITDMNMEHGDCLQISYVANEGAGLPNGTYTVGLPTKAFDVLPGNVNFGGVPTFTWYTDLDSTDDEGYQTTIAPIDSGTFTVEDGSANGFKKFTFNLKDDNGHTITGTADIPVFDGDAIYGAPAMKLRRR